jgi:two-component system response regulator VicR
MTRILIVDDEFSVADTLAEYLAWEGYTTTTAANGKLALAAIARERPQLVLLDYMMPVMDGMQMLATLRADPALKDLPVILMTAAPSGLTSDPAPYDALLVKPFDAARLLKTIRKVLGG